MSNGSPTRATRSSPMVSSISPSAKSIASASSAGNKQKPFVSPASPSTYKHIRAKVVSRQPTDNYGSQGHSTQSSGESSLSFSQGDLNLKDVSHMSQTSSSTVGRGEQMPFASSNVMGPPSAPKKGLRTPSSRFNTTPNTRARTPGNGSRSTAHGYRKTPGSVGSGKRKPGTAAEVGSRNYSKDLNLKPEGVLRLLTTIKSGDTNQRGRELVLSELIQKDSKKSPACASNLMGAFNGKDRKFTIADQTMSSITSTCTIEQGLSEFSFDGKQSEQLSSTLVEENGHADTEIQPDYKALLRRIKQENHDFVGKYAEHARNLYITQRNELLNPKTIVNAERSLNRLNHALSKLSSSTSTEYKVLRQSIAYEGDSIPCPFEARSEFVHNLERYDEMARQGKVPEFGNQDKLMDLEKNLSEQLNHLNLQLGQIETANEKYCAQSEKTAQTLKKYQLYKTS